MQCKAYSAWLSGSRDVARTSQAKTRRAFFASILAIFAEPGTGWHCSAVRRSLFQAFRLREWREKMLAGKAVREWGRGCIPALWYFCAALRVGRIFYFLLFFWKRTKTSQFSKISGYCGMGRETALQPHALLLKKSTWRCTPWWWSNHGLGEGWGWLWDWC